MCSYELYLLLVVTTPTRSSSGDGEVSYYSSLALARGIGSSNNSSQTEQPSLS